MAEGPVVDPQLLIRRPVSDVYGAFVDPAVTTKFWFTKSSGPLEPGASVRWDWEMYGVGADVTVKELQTDQHILIEWGEPPTTVRWTFDERPEGTLVRIVNEGFSGSPEEVTAQAINSMEGFAFLLAAAKAWLEHGIELHLVRDSRPDAHI